MDEKLDVYVVGYWSHIELTTTDYNKAKSILEKVKGRSPDLPWEIRNIQDAIKHAYEIGYQDGEDACY